MIKNQTQKIRPWSQVYADEMTNSDFDSIERHLGMDANDLLNCSSEMFGETVRQYPLEVAALLVLATGDQHFTRWLMERDLSPEERDDLHNLVAISNEQLSAYNLDDVISGDVTVRVN